MHRLAFSSVRLLASRTPLFVAHKVAAPAAVFTRGFAKRTIDAEVVSTEKQKKGEFLKLIEEEITVLNATNIGDEQTNTSLRGEVASRFLKESGFQVSEYAPGKYDKADKEMFDKDAGVIRLTRKVGDKTVTITFSDRPVESTPSEESQEEGEEGEEKEETENEEEEEGEQADEVRTDQPFRVEIVNGKGKKLHLNCFSSSDGSFIVSELNVDDEKRVPVAIGNWNEDLQREFLQWLEPLGINERLSYYIHQTLDTRTHEDNLETMKDLKTFCQ